MFPLDQFDFEGGSSDSYCSSSDFDSGGGSSIMKLPHLQNLDEYLHIVPSPFPFSQEEIEKFSSVQSKYFDSTIEPQNPKPHTATLASLGILKNYRSRFRQLNCDKVTSPPERAQDFGRKLSTDDIIRLAGENFIHSSHILEDSPLCHPFASSFLGLSNHETRDVELVNYLLASAEKVGQQHFYSATKFLNQCDVLSSNKGNSIQRLVHYFSLALREKIRLEIGITASKISGENYNQNQLVDLDEALMSASSIIISFHQKLPFSSVIQFSGMQAILENVTEAKKVHVIDLEIRNGMQYTVLMQALSARCECPVEYLRITAIGTKCRQKIEETGKRLTSFAQSINLPFYFNVVMVADMVDLNEDRLELETDEAVALYFPYVLSSMISQSDQIETLMKVVKNTNPRIVVVWEVEANHNSPAFVSRFVEALFFYGALFDSLEDSMDCNNEIRLNIESKYFFPVIGNIVSAKGGERVKRHVNVDVWRAFFWRYGLVDTELSVSLLYQASLVVNKFACGSSCTLDKNGNSLIVGWKGTPVFSVSTWKFC